MNPADLNEGVAVTNTVLNALLDLLTGPTSIAASQVKYDIGLLKVNAPIELNASPNGNTSFWDDLANCFDASLTAGATFAGMDTVRVIAAALTPIGLPAIAVRNFSVRMALIEQAKILAATTFTSRQQIDNFFLQINVSFNAAEKIAANNLDNVAYIALIQLHAAVANDLANRSRPLPRMVTYTYQTTRPALYIAQNLYQDPSRFSELIDENQPIHPLFMPATGKALAD